MIHPLVYPMFGQVALTFIFALFMLYVRVTEIKKGKTSFGYFRTFTGEASELVVKTGRHFSNLFEVPVIFFATVLLAIVMDLSDSAIYLFAWLFVISRVFHAFIHVFVKNIYPRMMAYMVGWICIIAMWINILS
jgi:hypothetical protein